MNACIGPISTPENSFQTTLTSGMGAISLAGSRSTARRRSTPPAKMLPKSRKVMLERLDQLLDDVEQHHGLERLQIVAEVTPQALFADPCRVHENDDEEQARR